MTIPAVGSFAQELYSDLQPLAYDDANQDWALLAYCGALGAMFQTVRDLARQDALDNPGWSLLLDVDRCPTAYLPYLGQFVGVQVDTSLTDGQQRDQIRAEQGMGRGTVAAIQAAARKFLTGSQTVLVLERVPDNYSYTVITYASETPISDVPTTNLVFNGGFEINTSTWLAGTGVTISQDLTAHQFGAASLKAVFSGSPSPSGFIVTTGAAILLPAGSVVTLSFWWDAPVGAQLAASIHFQNGASALTSAIKNVVGTGTWQKVTLTDTAPATTDRCRPQFNATGAYTANFDGIQLEQLPFATDYVDTNAGTASRAAGLGPVGAALRAAKPAGLILDYLVVSGETWAQLIGSYATWADVITAFPTWQDVINNTP